MVEPRLNTVSIRSWNCTQRGLARSNRIFSVNRRYSAATAAAIRDNVLPSQDALRPDPPPQRIPRLEALKTAKPFSAFLTDTFNRQHDYLRISITERCNLRCLYCMPAEGVRLSPKKHLLTPPEIHYLSSLFVSQGVTKIRLTGGEPTVHPQILRIMRDLGTLRDRGLREIALTTNGLSLSRKLDSMIESGLTGVNLSLDTIDPFQFEIMTRRKGFDQVMKSIERILELKRAGAPIKLKVNAVMIRGLNDAQLLPFVDFTRDKDLEVRFIEYMPFDGNKWSSQKMLTYQEMLAAIREHHPGLYKVQDHPNDTSKTFRVPGFAGRLGFITSMTEHFCGSCNRLRITSDGNLKVCLFGNAEVSLRDVLRKNFNDGDPIEDEAWEAMKQVEMDRREGRVQADPGLQEKEMELLEIIGMAVKRKKEKHADDSLGPQAHHLSTPLPIQSFSSSALQRPAAARRKPSYLATPFHILASTPSTRTPFIRPYSSHATSTSQSHNKTSHKPDSTSTSAPKEPPDPQPQPQLTHLDPQTSTAHMITLPPPFPSPSTSTQRSSTPSPTRSSPQPTTPSPTQPTHKPPTTRTAHATASLHFSNPHALAQIRRATLKKGDVLSVSRIAGIMAAKKTSDLIPLCHNVPLAGVGVDIEIVDPSAEGAGGGYVEGGGNAAAKSDGGHEEVGGDTAIFSSSSSSAAPADPPTSPPPASPPHPTNPKEEPPPTPPNHGHLTFTSHVTAHAQTGVEMEALVAVTAAALSAYDMCKAVDKRMRIEGTRVLGKTGGRSGGWGDGGR
ncbi:MAG: hypothetical protein M1831_001073 [Alyxoria varia]|nr:MAG: hypothetical protein M1831_001073 [Alyxoria varia]